METNELFDMAASAHLGPPAAHSKLCLNLGSLHPLSLPLYLFICIYIMCPFVALCLDILKYVHTKMNREKVR